MPITSQPQAVEIALGEGRELWPFHNEIGAAALDRDIGRAARDGERVADPAAHRVRHRHMRDATRSEKALFAGKGAVDELVDQHEIAGREILAQAADRRQRDDVGHAAALQRVDIGAEIDAGRRQGVAAPVSRQEYDRLPAESAKAELVGGLAERARHPPPRDVGEPVDLIEPAAADNADDILRHRTILADRREFNPRPPGSSDAHAARPRPDASRRRTPRRRSPGTG